MYMVRQTGTIRKRRCGAVKTNDIFGDGEKNDCRTYCVRGNPTLFKYSITYALRTTSCTRLSMVYCVRASAGNHSEQ